jgi:hypothetical protein
VVFDPLPVGSREDDVHDPRLHPLTIALASQAQSKGVSAGWKREFYGLATLRSLNSKVAVSSIRRTNALFPRV